MARVLGLFPAALTAARGGMSANKFYSQLRDLGIAPRRAEALQLFKIASNVVAKGAEEPFRNQQSVPTASEIAQWPTRVRAGIMQNVAVTFRDKTTGQLTSKPLSIKTEHGITRQEAIAKAIDMASEHSDAYNQEIVGAVHVATYELSPELLTELCVAHTG